MTKCAAEITFPTLLLLSSINLSKNRQDSKKKQTKRTTPSPPTLPEKLSKEQPI